MSGARRSWGRVPSTLDVRDRQFLMQARAAAPRISKHWYVGAPAPFDQRRTPHCVAYAWMGMLVASPTVLTVGNVGNTASSLYAAAQVLDDLDAGPEEGTTVRGAAKALSRAGVIAGYRWAFRADTVRDYLRLRGPVVLGLPWYDGMDIAARMTRSGRLQGGHAVVAVGYSMERDAVRILNSWGASWGDRGRGWLPLSTLDVLLSEEGAEACSAVENRGQRHIPILEGSA